jgi:hypothetical protein
MVQKEHVQSIYIGSLFDDGNHRKGDSSVDHVENPANCSGVLCTVWNFVFHEVMEKLVDTVRHANTDESGVDLRVAVTFTVEVEVSQKI